MKNESLLKNECLQLCTKMWQALPAALLPWPGFPCGSWWQAASQRKGGKQRLYRHLVNLWELLRSYQTKRGLMLDKELIQTPVSRRDRGGGEQKSVHRKYGTTTNTHAFFFHKWPTDRYDQIWGKYSTQRCVTACSHSTSATRLQGEINKMQHRYGRLQYMCLVFRGINESQHYLHS